MRFVDPKAEFLFVPTEKIEEIVKRGSAIPFDAPNVELGHHGEKCSFDAIVEKYGIDDPGVLELARIVRAADTDKLATVPEATGLVAVMAGIGMMAKDDYEAVEKASIVYDALYINCKLKNIRILYKEDIDKLVRQDRRRFLKEKLME